MKQEKKKVSRILWALTLVLMMLVTGVLGATEVSAAAVKAPSVNPVLYDATTISGDKVAKARVNKQNVIATVHVTLKGEDGTVKATLSVTPTSGTKWKVDLPEGVKVAKGDTVTVYQQIGEDKSTEVTKTAQPPKASTVTLTMPTDEIWIEQYVANIVNADEKAEAIDLLKKANPTIAKDIKSVEFTIAGTTTKTASYIVTYTDNSKTGEIQAPGLTIKPVTETSRSPEIGSITIVDNVVKGKLAGPGPFDGIKVQLVLRVDKDKADKYCNENKCKVDKDSSDPIDVTLQDDGTFSYTLQAGESLKLDQIVGVSVKEPHKFVSCSTTTVKPVPVEKTEVKDPRKLTAKDKEAIDAAIRKAYTVDGVSKLPNGIGDWDGVPAVIQIDDSGNVKIFSGNDVEVTYDSNYNPVPVKNADGSVKLNDGAKPKITIPAKDLVKNIKPIAPVLNEGENNKVTITPNNGDTDIVKVTVKYKNKKNQDQTVEITKTDGNWTIPTDSKLSVDAATGLFTFDASDALNGGTVTAQFTDNGGLTKDEGPLDSGSTSITLTEKVDVTFAGNGGGGSMDKVTVKKGSTYKLPANGFTAPENKEFDGWTVNGEDKKVGDEITVTDNTIVTAKWKDSMVDVTFVGNGGGGSMDKATVKKGSTYKLPESKFTAPENKEFDGWVVNGEDKKVGDEITVTDNTTVTAKWKDSMVDVTFNGNGGGGSMDKETVKKGSTYKLPESKFTAPENQEFAGWEVNGKAKNVGDTITVNGNTTVIAKYKDIEYKVTFDGNSGTGSMDSATVKKGEKYKLPDNSFGTPQGKQGFKAWEVDGKEVALGTEITIDKDTVVKAVWKDKPSKPGGGGRVIVDNNQTPKPEDKKGDLTEAALNKEDHYQYLIGYEDDSFKPENNMTREEVTVMFSRLLKNSPVKGQVYAYNFPDVDQSRWSVTAISYMNKLGIVKGYPDGDFKPEASITRAEFAAMAARFADLQEGDKTFSDLDSSHWAYDVVRKAASAGWISGYPDGTFKADNPITRAEVVTITNKMLNRKADQDFVDRNLDKLLSFIDLNKDYWAYYPIMEATNGHDYIRSTNKVDEKWQEVTNKSFVYDK